MQLQRGVNNRDYQGKAMALLSHLHYIYKGFLIKRLNLKTTLLLFTLLLIQTSGRLSLGVQGTIIFLGATL